MEELSIERFREIKARLAEIAEIVRRIENEEITEEEVQEMGLEEEIERIDEELHSHDLSKIPFEEYEGFYDLGFDFEGTGANLDFQIINRLYSGGNTSLRRCNVRNFDFDTMRYNDNTFDEDFKRAHSEHFFGYEDLEHIIPKKVRDRYYQSQLTLEDILTYDIPQEKYEGRLDYDAERSLERIPLPIIREMHDKEKDIDKLISHVTFYIEQWPAQEEMTADSLLELLTETAVGILNQSYIRQETYDDLLSIESVREKAQGRIAVIPEEETELREKFFKNELEYSDIVHHKDILLNGVFVPRMRYYRYIDETRTANLTERIRFYINTFPELAEKFADRPEYFSMFMEEIDPAKTIEENTQAIREKAQKEIREGNIPAEDMHLFEEFYDTRELIVGGDDTKKMYYERILEHVPEERLLQSGIPIDVLANYSVIQFISIYGLDTIMEFDRQNNGIFSQNNYEFMKKFSEYYVHYGSYMGSTLYKDGNYGQEQYSLEDFEDIIVHRVFMDGPTDGNLRDQSLLSDTDFSLEVKLRHPDVFLPENAPPELKEKYYPWKGKDFKKGILTPYDFAEHPDWIEFISPDHFKYIFKTLDIRIEDNDPYNYYKKTLKDGMVEKFGIRGTLEFIAQNPYLFDLLKSGESDLGYFNFDQFKVGEFETQEELLEGLYGVLADKAFNYKIRPGKEVSKERQIEYVKTMIEYPRLYMKQIGFGIDHFLENENRENIDIREYIEGDIERGLLDGSVRYNENAPEFLRTRHPELFLADDAPEELKRKYYTLDENNPDDMPGTFRSDQPKLNIMDLFNPEYRPFLEDKDISVANMSWDLSSWYGRFGREGIEEIGRTDIEAFELYSTSPLQAKLKNYLDKYPDLFARQELLEAHGFESLEVLENELANNPDLANELSEAVNKYRGLIIRSSGIVIHGNEEEFTREALLEYSDLMEKLPLKDTENYRRDVAERSLFNAYRFLGHDEVLKIIQVPDIDSDFLDAVYQTDQRIKELYERKYEITGNIKLLNNSFNGIATLLPGREKATSKNAQLIYRTINQKITEGFTGDFEELITQAFAENGFELDKDRLKELYQGLVKSHTDMKLDNIREYNSHVIDNGVDATPQTKRMLSLIYRKALEQSLNKFERIDPEFIREYLQEEMFKMNEDGTPRYSEVVRNNFENLARFAKELNEDPTVAEQLNKSITGVLTDESQKIGRGWIRKILSINDLSRQLTYEEAVALDKRIYPEGSELEVDTKPVIALKDLTEEERNQAMKILESNGFSNVLTFGKLEMMFSSLTPPFSENFRKFFLAHKDEFISNPELFSKFTKIANNFDEIIENPILNTKFSAGILSTRDVLNALQSIEKVYENQQPGEEELAATMKDLGLEKKHFETAQKIYAELLKREHQTIPPEMGRKSSLRGRIVRIDDPVHIAIGDGTDCCQTVGDAGETSMRHSALSNQGALFLVEEVDEFGQPKRIIAQSWTWRNGNRICFDNVEIPHDVEAEFRQIGGFDAIMEVYEEAAERMIETDKLALGRLLAEGKITEEQYRRSVIKDIAMGVGCDDLIHNLSPEKRKQFDRASIVLPVSESGHLYTDSKAGNILIRHNDEFEQDDHKHHASDVGQLGVKYTKIRDMIKRRGPDVHQGLIKKAKEILQKQGRLESSAFGKVEGDSLLDFAQAIDEVEYAEDGIEYSGTFEMRLSTNDDWFIFSEENENEVIIHESTLALNDEPKTERESLDNEMAKLEYQRQLLTIFAIADGKGKAVRINPEREGEYGNLQELIDDGIIAIEDGKVRIADKDKLKDKLETLDKAQETDRRKRLVSDIPSKDNPGENGTTMADSDDGER